jgi:hypothetical protein
MTAVGGGRDNRRSFARSPGRGSGDGAIVSSYDAADFGPDGDYGHPEDVPSWTRPPVRPNAATRTQRRMTSSIPRRASRRAATYRTLGRLEDF